MTVAGVSGSGKTTTARAIARITGVPHTELDALHHGPGWRRRAEFLDDVRDLVARASWVTEWQYSTARPLITRRADLLVWLDPPFWTTTFPRVVRRTVRRRVRREVLWNGNIEPPLWQVLTDREHIVRWAVSTRRSPAEHVTRARSEDPDLPVVRLRSGPEVRDWLAGPLRRAVGAEPG
ncbi:AAA family ATPase [Pseudonocardia sp. HH130630-07]|nr:AAA family ATPase [Pseudonocardia sp. HH130630-07]